MWGCICSLVFKSGLFLKERASRVLYPGWQLMQGSRPGTPQSYNEEDFAKEVQSSNRTPKTFADRFTAVFNKKGKDGSSKHGGEGSSTSTPKFSDRLVSIVSCSLHTSSIIINSCHFWFLVHHETTYERDGHFGLMSPISDPKKFQSKYWCPVIDRFTYTRGSDDP